MGEEDNFMWPVDDIPDEEINKIRFDDFNWSIDYRKDEREWEAPFRIRIFPNKNEQQKYKIVVFGQTEKEVRAKASKRLRIL